LRLCSVEWVLMRRSYLLAIAWGLMCHLQGAALGEDVSRQSELRQRVREQLEAELTPAAEKGDADAQARLGYMFQDQLINEHPDYERAMYWLKKSATQGHAAGQYSLGCMYHEGKGVPRDDAVAASWWEKAAAQGYFQAKKDLALMRGEPPPPTATEAYYLCAMQYAERFAKTKESPADIASAALSACISLRAAVFAPYPNLTLEATQRATSTLEDNARNHAIRIIMETRYPAK
jgi:TPR repeat protein